MKILIIKAGAAMLNLLYSLFKLLPVKDKIVFISRQGNTPSADFLLVDSEIRRRHPDYETVMLTKLLGKSVLEKVGYCFHILRQMYHIATAKMVILDSYCIPVSLLSQRRELVVIQMWHAIGSMKKFGYSILDKEEGTKRPLAEAMRMHRNYTYVFSSSKFCSPFFAEAFSVPLEKMREMPLPRLDLLFDEEYGQEIMGKIRKEYPQLGRDGKKVIVYAPTFRKSEGDFQEDELGDYAERLAQAVDYEKYDLVMKFHPLSDVCIKNENAIVDKKFSTIDFCRLADAVVLDYSAVVFEAALLGKPLYFYTYDYDSYMKNRAVYIDFKKYVPGFITGDARRLAEEIEKGSYDEERRRQFCSLMVREPVSGSYTEDIVGFMEETLGMR